jgi:hypothetical protein
MFRVGQTIIETEVGTTEARKTIADLLKRVELGEQVIHIKRHKKRIGALVSPEFAEGLVTILGPEGPSIPGDLAAAIKVVEGLMEADEKASPDLSSYDASKHAGLTGACISLIDILLPQVQDLPSIQEAEKMVANMLLQKLRNNPFVYAITRDKFPLVAGSLWATQVGDLAVDYRLGIPQPVSKMETMLWAVTLAELCMLINHLCGDGTAEREMYEVEEKVRQSFGGTEFEID